MKGGAVGFIVAMFAFWQSLLAVETNSTELQTLSRQVLPDCRLWSDVTGRIDAFIAPSREVLELATSAPLWTFFFAHLC